MAQDKLPGGGDNGIHHNFNEVASRKVKKRPAAPFSLRMSFEDRDALKTLAKGKSVGGLAQAILREAIAQDKGVPAAPAMSAVALASAKPTLFHTHTGGFYASRRDPYKRHRFPRDLTPLAVRWYRRNPPTCRDVRDLLAEHEITVDATTVHRRVQKFAPVIRKRACDAHLSTWGLRWHVDRTYF